MGEVIKWILYFFIYAFIGWLCEVVYCSIPKKKLVNRGFLYAPICPIYGFGAILVLLPLEPLKDYFYLVFIIGLLITSCLEYLTSLVMEKLFKMRWWDYSHHKFNIKGRVCLLNSVLFGLLCLAMVYLVHPLVIDFIDLFNPTVTLIASIILVIAFIVDTIFSTIAAGKFNSILERIKHTQEDIDANYDGKLRKYIYSHFIHKFPRLKSINNNEIFERIKLYILEKKEKFVDKFDEVKEKLLEKKEQENEDKQ